MFAFPKEGRMLNSRSSILDPCHKSLESINKTLLHGVNNGGSSPITQESLGSSSVVRDAHSNFDSSTDNQLTTSNGNNHPEKHLLSMHEKVCNNKKLYLLCKENSNVLNIE